MKLMVNKSAELSGRVIVPGSKSHAIRAILLALLAKGESTLMNVPLATDIDDAKRICVALGMEIQEINGDLKLNSSGVPFSIFPSQLNSGNSGITTLFILPILGLRQALEPLIFDCGAQMRTRPVHALVAALNQLGMQIHYLGKQGALPVHISGQLLGGKAEVDGISSQFISALLLALPCVAHDSEITVKNLHERPYMEMTLSWLQRQKINFQHERRDDSDIFYVSGGQHYQPLRINIPGDFSSAANLIAAGILTRSTIELVGLDNQDSQGDKKLITILQEMGAHIETKENSLKMIGGNVLSGMTIDANDIPDLVPILAVIGTQAQGKTEILNVPQARIKETDRIKSMTEGLRRLGAQIDEKQDGLVIYQSKLHGNQVEGYHDHRTVMALSVAGMLTDAPTIITNGEAIQKTFPQFVELMQGLGANMRLEKT